jgi:hypothetical protein
VATPITDVDEFTDPITVPEDGDDRDALSVQTPIQGLANRTRHTSGRVDTLIGTDWTWAHAHRFNGQVTIGTDLYHQDILYDPPVIRTMMLPLDLSFPGGGASASLDSANLGWSSYDGYLLQGAGAFNSRRWPFRLPHETTIMGVNIGYYSVSPHRAQFWLRRIRATKAAPFAPSVADLAYSDVTIATQEVPIAPINLPVAVIGALDTFAVDVLMSASAQAIRYIEVMYSEILATGHR